MTDHLPPPPPGVPGRDTPPPYTPPPTYGWGPPPPPTPTPERLLTYTMRRKRNVGPVILGALAVLLLGAILGSLVRGGNDPSVDTVTAAAPTTTATARPVPTTVYRTTSTTPTLSEREIQELALDMTWDKASYSDQQDICDGVDLFGVDYAAGLMNEGADYTFDEALIRSKLVEWCNTY